MLEVPFFAPHSPNNYPPQTYRRPYRDFHCTCIPRTPPHPLGRGRFRQYFDNPEAHTSYSALVIEMDANVGRVLAMLKEFGVRENTVVVLSEDQGFGCGHHGVRGKGDGTIPLNMYEESICIP